MLFACKTSSLVQSYDLKFAMEVNKAATQLLSN